MKHSINGAAIIFYALILLLLIVLTIEYSKGDTEKRRTPTDKEAWQKEHTHLKEALSTLHMTDKGITEIDHQIKQYRMSTGGMLNHLHATRAKYIENRIGLLYHLHTLTPPNN